MDKDTLTHKNIVSGTHIRREEKRATDALLKLLNECVLSTKNLCSVKDKWQGGQCIHPVDYINSVHIVW